jgi:hypothetical protein
MKVARDAPIWCRVDDLIRKQVNGEWLFAGKKCRK